MILFTGLVQDVQVSKDGSKKYLEFADREQFVTYRVQVPMDTPLEKGEIVELEIVRIRSYNSSLSMEGRLSKKAVPQGVKA
ncbi:hypothetical protein ACOJUR_00110 [Alicyclobacillus tolerans]|uniref:hypothetical protein n=1 Tax=Alicyclobacillus tolerans TaxID=90970 RepID=UPI003B7FE308